MKLVFVLVHLKFVFFLLKKIYLQKKNHFVKSFVHKTLLIVSGVWQIAKSVGHHYKKKKKESYQSWHTPILTAKLLHL